jgi:dTDP-4-dehydrorhamnose reductase
MRILILGGTGMVGHKMFQVLSERPGLEVFATARDLSDLEGCFSEEERGRIRTHVDASDFDTVIRALASIQPDAVINCIGLIKQLPLSEDPLTAITVNAQLPHRISLICRTAGARMIQIGTDCVYDGTRGNYRETDPSDAKDLYGRTKYLGEVAYEPHCLTLRTSIIGPELKGRLSLVEWFLAQEGPIRGYTRAIYSGLTTLELARVMADFVLPRPDLTGLYHLSVDPISKYELLGLIARTYGRTIQIEPDHQVAIDRSLDSSRFRAAVGYAPPSWPELVADMHRDWLGRPCYRQGRVGD